MKLFSEKVNPTFTSSSPNILTVKDYNEIFFDVYEFEINGNSYIAEKVSSHKGIPIVNIPVVKDNKQYLCPFILNKGTEFEVIFNSSDLTLSQQVISLHEERENKEENFYVLESLIDSVEEFVAPIDNTLLDQQKIIRENIDHAKKTAKEYIESLLQKKNTDVIKARKKQQVILERKIDKIKESFVEDFLKLTLKIREGVDDLNSQNKIQLENFISEYLKKKGVELSKLNKSNYNEAIITLQEYVEKIAVELLSKKIKNTLKNVNEQVSKLADGVEKNESSITEISNNIEILEKINIELNDKVTRQTNRALSRIGTVRTDLEKTLDESIKRISEYYTNKIFHVETKIGNVDNNLKQTIVTLIDESRESLISELSSLQVELPNIVIESKDGKRKDIDVSKLKTELEKSISTRFSSEIMTLKKMIELSHGSGSVAVQYANGGIMDGSLIITGSLSAGDYLGLAASLTGAYLPITGGTVTGPVTLTSYLSTNSIRFNTGYDISPITGELAWDVETNTLTYGVSDSTKIHIGLEDFYRVKANGSSLPAGSVVWATSAISVGNSGIILGNNIPANSQADPKYLLGVTSNEIESNDIGLVTNFGVVKEVNLSALADSNEIWNVGDVLYPSSTIPGGWTNIEPQPPNLRIALGFILFINNPTGKQNVTMMIRASEHGFRLEELHNVFDNGYTHANGTILAYNTNLSGWLASPQNDVVVATLSASSTVSAPNITNIEDKLNSIYTYIIQNFDRNVIATSTSITQFVATEWSPSLNLSPGDTVTLSAANIVYVLSNSDGSGANNYFEVNLKPNFLFYRTNVNDYDVLDSFPLSAMKSSKYVVEVEDKETSDIFYAELNLIGNSNIAVTTEYGSNYTTALPFIEFGGAIINNRISLSAVALEGHNMEKFVIKGNRTVFF